MLFVVMKCEREILHISVEGCEFMQKYVKGA